MPLRLIPPRKGKTPNWGIRGTYLKVAVDRSSGTHRKAVANRVRQQIERAIERGDYPAPRPSPDAPTFLSAAAAHCRPAVRKLYPKEDPQCSIKINSPAPMIWRSAVRNTGPIRAASSFSFGRSVAHPALTTWVLTYSSTAHHGPRNLHSI